jgi:glycerate 2-kinase
MSNLFQLRTAAREIFDNALRGVDCRAAVLQAVRREGSLLQVGPANLDLANRKLYLIALGKARFPIFRLEDELGDLFASGFLSGFPNFTEAGRENVDQKRPTRWRWCQGGHPLPTQASLLAAEAAMALLDRANEEGALVVYLISGGGSAMMEWPISEDISLANLRTANQVLVASGASIGEINAVRRAFSAVKGGRLAARAPNCEQITLIVSDVPKGDEYNVASGPTITPPVDAPGAAEVLAQSGLRDKLPASIVRAIDNPLPFDLSPPTRQEHFVLLDNETALEAASRTARERGFTAEIARDISDQPIEVGVEGLLIRLADARKSADEDDGDVCLVSGGEFSCPVRGDGIGGRNLETALRLAVAADQNPDRIGEFVALCAGTDGIDGNSPAAGAVVDSTTMERARRIGLDPIGFLERSDSYSFFVALGDAITTGPTGTNVRDLRILLAPTCQNRER